MAQIPRSPNDNNAPPSRLGAAFVLLLEVIILALEFAYQRLRQVTLSQPENSLTTRDRLDPDSTAAIGNSTAVETVASVPAFRSMFLKSDPDSPLASAPVDYSLPGGIPTTPPSSEIDAPNLCSAATANEPEAGPEPGPSTATGRGTGRWYVVFRGLQIGIFRDWWVASQFVSGVSHAVHKSYSTLEEARAAFEAAGRQGSVRIIGGEEEEEEEHECDA